MKFLTVDIFSGSNVSGSNGLPGSSTSLSLSVLGSGSGSSGGNIQAGGGASSTTTSRGPSNNAPSSSHRAVSSGGTAQTTTRIVGFTTNSSDTPRSARDREGWLTSICVYNKQFIHKICYKILQLLVVIT